MLYLFKALIAAHAVAGATGLIAFWVPILARKGGKRHRTWGRVFAYALLAAGGLAFVMSLMTIAAPWQTHPHLRNGPLDEPTLTGLFGWLMLYLGTLTMSLAWFGLECVLNKRNHAANRHWLNIGLQIAAPIAATMCAYQGWQTGQAIMIGVAPVGFASSWINLSYIFTAAPEPGAYLQQHLRALIGAGISVYTAFLAFGAVQLMPSHAFNPTMWSVPSIVGIGLVLYYKAKLAAGALPHVVPVPVQNPPGTSNSA